MRMVLVKRNGRFIKCELLQKNEGDDAVFVNIGEETFVVDPSQVYEVTSVILCDRRKAAVQAIADARAELALIDRMEAVWYGR